MDWLNYHHLLYFWLVAKEGGLKPAGKLLRLSHPTISAQIHALEAQLEEKLFVKSGRKLQLTEMGHVVFRYADEIFRLGHEMLETVRGKSSFRPVRLEVGVVDVVPKLVVRKLLEPAFALTPAVKLVCHEDTDSVLLSRLAQHEIDVVIADTPVPPGSNIRAYNHLLGECGVTLFATAKLAAKYQSNFPKSLHGAPMLLPLEHSTLRRSLNQWFESIKVTPEVIAEFEDSALMKVFGSDGVGIFVAPTAVRREVEQQYEVVSIGDVAHVRERFYIISIERRLKHPAVVALCEAARQDVFSK
jgi:LysR family transcriptional regulator, transcriptional activator of nhaA